LARKAIGGDEGSLSLRALLEESSSLLILSHQNADPDAVCSMAAVAEIYGMINKNGTFGLACDDVSRLAAQVLETFRPGTHVSRTVDGTYDLVIIVDTNNRYQLGEALQSFRSDRSRTVIIDHHEPSPEASEIAEHLVIRSNKSSTCEIVIDLFDDLGLSFTEVTANLLLAGLLFDTRRFFYTSADTLSTAIRLVRAGANYQACIGSLVTRLDRSEKIARLKAAERSEVFMVNDWIIVTSRVGAFEASACRGLIELGADVAIVGGTPSKDSVRISSRSTTEFYQQTHINLGTDVMEPLGGVIDGVGGGHPNAAGANGKKNCDRALARSVELIKEAMNRGKVSANELMP
jgi:bifunctional oligoribonuclease and PAP phosphatase NrnA